MAFDPDREDLEWDDSLRAHSDGFAADRDRAIRPLPKRQRLHEHAQKTPTEPTPLPAPSATARAPGPAAGKRERASQDAVERDSFDPVVTVEPALEYRIAAGRLDDDSRAVNHTPPPRARSPAPVQLDPADPELDPADYPEADEQDQDPPNSPPSSVLSLDDKHREPDDDQPDRGPDYFPVFGDAGADIVRSLASASAFSAAGLFGGLGLAALHPSLAPPADRDQLDDDDDDDEGYSLVRERSYAERSSGVSIAVGGVVGGNNKKKRKIPGVNQSSAGEDDDRGFDGDDLPEPIPYKAPGMRSDFASDLVVNKGTASDSGSSVAPLVLGTNVRLTLAGCCVRHQDPRTLPRRPRRRSRSSAFALRTSRSRASRPRVDATSVDTTARTLSCRNRSRCLRRPSTSRLSRTRPGLRLSRQAAALRAAARSRRPRKPRKTASARKSGSSSSSAATSSSS